MKRTQIQTKYLSQLVDICTDSHCDHSVREKLLSILRDNLKAQTGFTNQMKSKLELAELARVSVTDDEDKFLVKLAEVGSHVPFLDENYIQLANILNRQLLDVSSKRNALSLLESYKFKSELSEELRESLALLYESTSLSDVKNSCLGLLGSSSAQSSTSFRIDKILRKNADSDITGSDRQKLLRDSPLVDLFRQQLKMTNEQIDDLLNIVDDCEMLLAISSLDKFLEVCFNNQIMATCDIYNSSAIIYFIEQVLITSELDACRKLALTCYNRLIKRGRFQNLKAILEQMLALLLHPVADTELTVALTECIFLSIPYLVHIDSDLFVKCIEALEYKLDHEYVSVRVLSYAGLSLVANQFSIESSFFNEWCSNLLEELSKLANVQFTQEERQELIYVILFLKYIDFSVFKKNREVWHRELLISNLFQQLEPCSDTEMVEFYSRWLQVEEKHQSQVKGLIFLFHLSLNISLFESLKQVNELLFIIQQSTTIPNLLEMTVYDSTMLFQCNLKQNWCMDMICCSLRNMSDIDQVYVKRLVATLCKDFEAEFIQKLFDSVTYIDDLKAFESLVEFCSRIRANRILVNFMNRSVRCSSVSELMSLLQIEDLCDNIISSSKSSNTEQQALVLYGLLRDMLKKKGSGDRCGWTFEQLNRLVCIAKQNQDQRTVVQSIINLFQLISFFALPSVKYEVCVEIFEKLDALKLLNKMIVENKFHQRETIKNADELLQELKDDNDTGSNDQLKDYILNTLPEQLRKVKHSLFKSQRSTNFREIPISQWERKHITLWASHVIDNRNEQLDIVEAIAVVKRANFWHTGFHLTDTQIVACLISLCEYASRLSESTRGKLLQVATGEGKSTIVCILTIVSALKELANGRRMEVDVITSSPVLAERDAIEKAKLFRMFNLTCSFNNDTVSYIRGESNALLI